MKQKKDSLKGDWYQTLKKDFKLICMDMKDEEVMKIPKSEYKKNIKQKVTQAAFKVI